MIPNRGGTGGGVLVTISGSQFSSDDSEVHVTIDGVNCTVQSVSITEVKCITGKNTRTIKSKVRMEIGSRGIATQEKADFQYVDLWSSPYSWGNNPPPGKGKLIEFVSDVGFSLPCISCASFL